MHLVGDQHEGVVDVSKLLEIFQVTVEFLLAVCQHTTADVFCTEVACQGIDNNHLHIEAFAHALDFVNQEHLVC